VARNKRKSSVKIPKNAPCCRWLCHKRDNTTNIYYLGASTQGRPSYFIWGGGVWLSKN